MYLRNTIKKRVLKIFGFDYKKYEKFQSDRFIGVYYCTRGLQNVTINNLFDRIHFCAHATKQNQPALKIN